MMSKFSQQQQQQQHQNILQPKRLNSTDSPKITKGGHHRQPSGMITGQTLTLNGVTIGLPPLAQSATSLGVTTPASKKGSNTMAKRNARERNRVKQVNLGFQTLRQHIPDTYRMKKMSKVDTLRCAVDYIRSMEQILEITPMPCPGIASAGDNMMMTTRVSPYDSFSSPDMNQHLDSICMEEGSSISLEQSYSSSFSENDEENLEYCSQNELKYRTSLDISGPLHHQFTDQQERQECSETVTIVTTTGSNSIPLQALVMTTDGCSSPIVIPVQLQPSLSSSSSSSPLDKNGEILATDENFNPPSSSSSSSPFIRVVEIIQLQS